MYLLADGAPSGAGLAIVGGILLAFLAIAILVVFFVLRFIVRAWRRSHPKPAA